MPSHCRTITHILRPVFLFKSKCWFPLHSFLKICLHRTVQAQFFVSHNSPPEFYSDLTLHVGHHPGHTPVSNNTSMPQSSRFGPSSSATFDDPGPSTSMSSLLTDGWANSADYDPSHTATSSASIPPPFDPYSNQITTINSTESHDLPFEFLSPTSIIAPIAIEKERWYSQYGINRDADGLFHCPDAGCNDKKKRRDQLWEHWKAKHNDDPYRCTSWSVLPYKYCPLDDLNPLSATKHGFTTARRHIRATQK